MLSIWQYLHARSQSLSALDGHINNVLLQNVPDFSEALLQLIDTVLVTVHTTFIQSLLHNTPDLIIHWIRRFGSGLWWPEIRINEVRRFLL